MSFITFLLITCVSAGLEANKTIVPELDEDGNAIAAKAGSTTEEFRSDKLTYVFSKCLFIWIFEVLIQKGMFVMLNLGNPNFFELMAYCGYKFVVLCLVMLAHLYSLTASYVTMGVFGILFCYFFFCTLRRYQTAHTLADHARESSNSFNKSTF